MRQKKTHILFLEKDDPKKEAELELEFILSLTMRERMKIMERLYTEGIKLMKRNGYKNIPSITARS